MKGYIDFMDSNNKKAIDIANLTYVYRTWTRRPGLKGAILDIFKKKKKKNKAINNLTMQIEEKSIAGFLGPNGCGKSTLIKILSGILYPAIGNVTVLNHIPWKQRKALAKKIGVIFGNRTHLWPDPPVYDSLRMISHMYDISKTVFKNRIDTIGKVLDTTQWLYSPPRTLSLGQRMRCDLMAALIHNPAILFLDEPTLGVDVPTRFLFYQYLHEIRNAFNTTIILASHEIYDIESTCDTIFLFNKGTLIESAPTKDFFNQMTDLRHVKIVSDTAIKESIIKEVKSIQGIVEVKHPNNSNTIEIKFKNSQGQLPVLAEIMFSKLNIMDFIVKEPTVEELLRDRFIEFANEKEKED